MKIRVPSKARDKLKIKAKKELTTMTEIIRRAILRECRRKWIILK